MGRGDPRAATNARSAGVFSGPKVGHGEALKGQIVSCGLKRNDKEKQCVMATEIGGFER